jgi:hypothetical protein
VKINGANPKEQTYRFKPLGVVYIPSPPQTN